MAKKRTDPGKKAASKAKMAAAAAKRKRKDEELNQGMEALKGNIEGSKEFLINYLKSPKYKLRHDDLVDSEWKIKNYIHDKPYLKDSRIEYAVDRLKNTEIIPLRADRYLDPLSAALRRIQGEPMPSASGPYYNEKLNRMFLYSNYTNAHNEEKATSGESIPAHEMSHTIDSNIYNRLDIEGSPANIDIRKRMRNTKGYHDSDPSETKGDVYGVRYLLDKNKLYDSQKDFTKEDLDKIRKSKIIEGDSSWERLQRLYKDEDLIHIMNTVASNKGTSSKNNMAALGGEFISAGQTDPPNMLQTYYELMGHSGESYKKFDSFLQTLAEVESFSGKKQDSTLSSAKGLYHYIDDAVTTSDNRIKNLLKRNKVPKVFSATLEKELKKPVQDRSPEVQGIMVLSDLMEAKDAPFKAWIEGKVEDKELYYRGHHSASKKSASSPEKVYENWNNATMRVKKSKAKNNKYHDGGEATDITAPRFSELGMGDQFKNLFNPGAAGSMLDLAGGPLGLANIAAGVAAPLVSMAFDNPLQKTNTGNLEDFDFGAKYSRTDAKKTAKTDATFDAIGGAMEGIPLIGNILGLGMDGFKGISRLFNKGSSNKQIMGDYMAQFRQQNQAQKKELYANAFNSQAAMGGEFPGTGGNGVYNIQMNDTHEQNPMGGYTFGMAPDGSKNTAEAGEVIIDGKDGNKLVFTNKF